MFNENDYPTHHDLCKNEAAALIVSFILGKFSGGENVLLTKTHSEEQEKQALSLICTTAELIVKFYPTLKKFKDPCCKALFMLNEANNKQTDDMKAQSYRAFLLLTGDIHGFNRCPLTMLGSAIGDAIVFLCDHPHSDNLPKAQRLLAQGTPEALFFYKNSLTTANQAFIQASLKKIDPEGLSGLIPSLFLHLCYPIYHRDCFEMTKDEVVAHFDRLEEKRVGKSPNVKLRFGEIRLTKFGSHKIKKARINTL